VTCCPGGPFAAETGAVRATRSTDRFPAGRERPLTMNQNVSSVGSGECPEIPVSFYPRPPEKCFANPDAALMFLLKW